MLKHPLEDDQSWDLFEQEDNDVAPYPQQRLLKKHKSKKKQKQLGNDVAKIPGVPLPEKYTVHGLLIDAGSQGTRLHIYEFERRYLQSREELTKALNGLLLSIPTTNTRWTNRLKPGLDHMVTDEDPEGDDESLQKRLIDYLGPMMDFAKGVLAEKKDEWHLYPIYLKATGGLRTLPTNSRVRLVSAVRTLLQQNKTFNPFNIDDPERVRVISGEKEAIYGWAAVNFAKGTLVKDSEGTGTVLDPQKTVGMLEMGGASTQIAFFQNNGDIMANLMKLQIGGARHWNLYAHSFLYFGVNGAWARLNAVPVPVVSTVGTLSPATKTYENPCLPSNATTKFDSWIHKDEKSGRFIPRSSPLSVPYSITLTSPEEGPSFEMCSNLTRALLRKHANQEWVEFSHDGDCSFAGVYQPPLAQNGKNSTIGDFIVTSNYYDIWRFLGLPNRANVRSLRDGAKRVCELSAKELDHYNRKLDKSIKPQEDLYQYCFRATFAFEMIHTGYGFPLDYELEAADIVDGQKLGWALGSILYEINTLPWEFRARRKGAEAAGVAEALATLPASAEGALTQGNSLVSHHGDQSNEVAMFLGSMFLLCILAFLSLKGRSPSDGSRRRKASLGYEAVPSTNCNNYY